MSYYLAPSLAALRSEANARWPDRDTTSDGWIGDTSHAARKSDHNPDWSAGGVVRAYDIDEDLDGTQADNGAELMFLAEHLRHSRDPRIKYVISEGLMFASYESSNGPAWKWRTYDGVNAHRKHLHVSVLPTWAGENDTRPWFPPEEDPLSALSDAEQRELLANVRELAQRDPETWKATAGDGRLKEVTLAVRALLGVDATDEITEAFAAGEGRQALKTLVQGAVLDGLRPRTDARPDRGVLRAEIESIIVDVLARPAEG